MDIQSTVRFARVSPRKLTYTAKTVTGKPAEYAVSSLRFMNTKPSFMLSKAIASAVANARSRKIAQSSDLVIRSIIIGKGPMLKRYNPVSRGMAHEIHKRTSHVTVILTERVREKEKQVSVVPPVSPSPVPHSSSADNAKSVAKKPRNISKERSQRGA